MLEEKDLQAIAQLINGAVEPINKRLDNIEQDIKTLQGDVQSMQGDIKTLQSEVQSMQGDIKTLQNDVKDNNKTTKRIEGKIDAGFAYFATSIDKFDRRMTYETVMLKKSDMAIADELKHLHA